MITRRELYRNRTENGSSNMNTGDFIVFASGGFAERIPGTRQRYNTTQTSRGVLKNTRVQTDVSHMYTHIYSLQRAVPFGHSQTLPIL